MSNLSPAQFGQHVGTYKVEGYSGKSSGKHRMEPKHRGDGQQSYVPKHRADARYYPTHKGPHAMIDTATGRRVTGAEAQRAQDNPLLHPTHVDAKE